MKTNKKAMITITNVTASQRVLAHLDEGRLTRGQWHTTKNGRELACVLGSMDPAISRPVDCPASVMPSWLANLTVTLFDRQSDADAMAWARRYAGQMARWHALDSAAWDRVNIAFRIACVETAMSSAEPVSKGLAAWPWVKAACEGVVTALRTGVGMDEAKKGADAAYAAYAAYADAAYAAYAASAYAAYAAYAAVNAAYAAVNAAATYAAADAAYAAYAAANAAADAAYAATNAAYAAYAAVNVANAAADAAYAAELSMALCDLIDAELATAEVRR